MHQDFGSIVFNNSNIDNLNVEKRSRLGISQSFQNNSLFNEMTVKENLMVASSQSLKITWNIFRSLDKNSDVLNKSHKICKQVGLSNYYNYKSENLSYGLQRQLEIGLAIAGNPKLLLLDEPTAGMSNDETIKITSMIKKLSSRYTIVIVEHDMDVIYSLAKEIYVLDSGNLIFNGTPNQVKKSSLVQARYMGIKK